MKNEKELLKNYDSALDDIEVYIKSIANMSNVLLRYYKIYFEKNMDYCEFKIKEMVTDEKIKKELLKVIRENREKVDKLPKKLSKDKITEISDDIVKSMMNQVPELLNIYNYEEELCKIDKGDKFNIKGIIKKLH